MQVSKGRGRLLPAIRWAQGCERTPRRWGGQGGSCLLLTLLDFLIDFVPVPLAGCATTLPENHFSDLKIEVLKGHLKCPRAYPPPAAHGEGTPSPIQGRHPQCFPQHRERVSLFQLPALSTSIPLVGEMPRAPGTGAEGDVSSTRLMP